ncbi:MAG: hypothetical protein HY040_28610 [Planctomycetes bacterium]|nr:hypothetical protein [Planctomycetota bacterium]
MRRFRLLAILLPALAITAFATLEAQEPEQKTSVKPALARVAKHDLDKLTDKQRFFYLSGQRGLEWLKKANKPDGRFVYGFLPALSVPVEGDSFLHQGGAAMATARTAAFYGDKQGAAIARQALLTLFLETIKDAKEPHLRYTAAPPELIHRPTASAMLALAVHELDSPGKDLLDDAEGICNYLRKLVKADGSLHLVENDTTSGNEAQAIQHYSGLVLHAIVRSQEHRPAAWKLEALRKARPFYHAYWKQNKNAPMIPEHTAAYVEAFLLTKEQGFADVVFEMNDWLCQLQYQDMDRRRSAWAGGFQNWVDGKAVQLAPNIDTAPYAESLAEACRVAKVTGDVQRFERYRAALESSLKFLTLLQYNEANARHFADWFRPAVVGGFHASLQDGNLRIDYGQHAVSALTQYLRCAAELP